MQSCKELTHTLCTMSHTDPTDTERGTERIEAFSDGVFAIAITVVILDVHASLGAHLAAPRSLLGAAIRLWPTYFPSVLSFLAIGIYWTNHHYAFKLFTKTNHTLNLLNLLFLLTIAFLPFPTETLGRFVRVTADQRTAAGFYSFALLLAALAWLVLWLYATKAPLVGDDIDTRYLHRLTLHYVGSVMVYSLAVTVALVNAEIGLVLCTAFTSLYLVPPSLIAAHGMKEASRE